MDPITVKIAASVAAALFGQAARPAGEAIRDAAFGKREMRAAEAAIRRAVDQGVEEVCASGMPDEIVQHVLSMIHYLVDRHYDLGADLLGRRDEVTALKYWNEAAQAAGWDLSTFPVHFPSVVASVTRHIPSEIRSAAGEADSPLHNRISLALLERVESRLGDLQQLNTVALSRDIPMAEPLLKTLEDVKATCRASDSRILTPHVLLAVLRSSSAVRLLFDHARSGLATDIQNALANYVRNHKISPFVDLDWRERLEVQAARVVAIRLGVPVVTDRLLLLGVLETPSNTSRQLTAMLGEEVLAAVKSSVLRSPASQTIGTPGEIFKQL